MPSRVHNVRATCQRFRDILDDMVQELWILNASPYLTMDAVCKKLERCRHSLRRLTLYRVYPSNADAVRRLDAALDCCGSLDTLCITPGGGLRGVHTVVPKQVSTIIPIPFGAAFDDTCYEVCAAGDWALVREVMCPATLLSGSTASRDPAILSRPSLTRDSTRHGEFGAIDICYRDQLRSSQRIVLPGVMYKPFPVVVSPGRYWLSFGELTNMMWCNIGDLPTVDTWVHTNIPVILDTTMRSLLDKPHYLSRVCNLVVPSAILAKPVFRFIRVAVDHAVTLWVHHSDLHKARGILPARMSLAPLWDIEIRSPRRAQFVNPLLSAPPPHP